MLRVELAPHLYAWPRLDSIDPSLWRPLDGTGLIARAMPESQAQIERDSRWPALFPSPVCIVTTSDGDHAAMERVVGPSIVNRFPYVMALSVCVTELSARHHARARFIESLERGRQAVVQFLPPGPALDSALGVIASIPDAKTETRIEASGLPTRRGFGVDAPVLQSAYLAYEGRLVAGGGTFDVGSHRVFLLEISAIQLREDIADARQAIFWQSLPEWEPAKRPVGIALERDLRERELDRLAYRKPYTAHYRFPASSTVAFEPTARAHGMAIRDLPPLPEDHIEVDNERARWPCFFPSSVGIITSWTASGHPAVMPCGSTMVVSRQPLVIAPCVSYSAINERYAPRGTLDAIRHARSFACGVPYLSDEIIEFITYTGNVSLRDDPGKLAHAGLEYRALGRNPVLLDLPVTFDCRLVGEKRLGTHVMFLGEVERILVRQDLSAGNALRWCPWATVTGS